MLKSNMMTPDQKIEICKQTRALAQKALFDVLEFALKQGNCLSEAGIRDLWLGQLRKNSAIFQDGWYSPPPHGIGLLIGSGDDGGQSRVNCVSLRPADMWPQENIRLNVKNGIIFAYASPFDKKTGIIGDFGMTVYFGKNQEIINHLKLCRKIVRQIFDYVSPGILFSQISARLAEIMASNGLSNNIAYAVNLAPAEDVAGHTIPFVAENMTEAEAATLAGGNYELIKEMISKKRQFVRNSNDLAVTNGMAFTIEPRPRVIGRPDIPMVWFHCIFAIREDGTKELLENFDGIFNLSGMRYMKE